MVLSVLNLVFFLSLSIYYWNKKRTIDICIYVLLVYLFSSVFSCVIMSNPEYYGFLPDDVDITASIVYWLLIGLAMFPLSHFHSEKIDKVLLDKDKIKVYKTICWILIVLTVISIVTSFDTIRSSVVDNDYANLYLLTGRARREIRNTRFSNNTWDIIVSIAPSFSPVFLLFFFYNISFLPNEKPLTICLLIASLAQTIVSITTASRVQVIYWLLSFGALWVLFRSFLPQKTKKIVKVSFIAIFIICFVYFMTVTYGRFSMANKGVENGLIKYAGQQYIQFCKVFQKYSYEGVTWDRTFPIITKYIFGHNFNTTEYRTMMSARIGTPVGVFFTYLGDAMLDFGKVGVFLYQLLLSIFEIKMFRRYSNQQIYIYDLVIFFMLIRIPLLGLFAYVYKSVADSIILILCVLIRILLNNRIRFVFKTKNKQR